MTIRDAAEFIRLRESSDPEEYRRAAAEDAPLEVWLDIVENHRAMRFWVAQNKTVPQQVLRILASDEDARVRAMTASKRSIEPDLLSQLADDPDDAVRAAVARNRSTPRETLQRLREDPWEGVREVVEERLA